MNSFMYTVQNADIPVSVDIYVKYVIRHTLLRAVW